jgi:beta-lactamase class D
MKAIPVIALAVLFMSCRGSQPDKREDQPLAMAGEVVVPAFQAILDTARVEGAILIYDLQADQFYSNDFSWAKKGYLPASTFKIPNSIIALETGVVNHDSTLFPWNGEKRNMKVWEQDLVFRDAFHLSCVPCYQEVARKIGLERMTDHLTRLNFGAMQVDAASIDIFWLEGDSKINSYQQIDFLKRLYQSELPISKRTEAIIKRMIRIEANDGVSISGKTGWSIREGQHNGWFVGYLESGSNVYFFATNIVPQAAFEMNMFPMIRKEVTYQAFRQLEIMK